MKAVLITSLLCMVTIAAAQAGNPEWEQATKLYNSGDYRAALSAFRKISEKNPAEPRAHYMLAQCYKGTGNTKQAITELEWISTASTDKSVTGAAESLLAQLKGSGGGSASASASSTAAAMPVYRPQIGPHGLKPSIPNAISPYSVPPGGYSSGATNDKRGPIK